jgi:hypothetical protein
MVNIYILVFYPDLPLQGAAASPNLKEKETVSHILLIAPSEFNLF